MEERQFFYRNLFRFAEQNSPECIFLWENFARVGDVGAEPDLRREKHLHHCKIPDLEIA
jgi:hypothetical protein